MVAMLGLVRFVDAVSRALGVVAVVLLIAAVLVVNEMVSIRYVLRGSTVWQTEFVTYSLMAATFLGSPWVLMMKGHVNVDLLPIMLPAGPCCMMQISAGLASLVFCALLAWSGWTYFHEAWSGGWTTDTVWKLPLWIPLLPLPAGIGWLCIQYLAELHKTSGASS